MRESLWVVAIDGAATVISTRLMLPGRMIRLRGACWLLELPASVPPPCVGSRLELLVADS